MLPPSTMPQFLTVLIGSHFQVQMRINLRLEASHSKMQTEPTAPVKTSLEEPLSRLRTAIESDHFGPKTNRFSDKEKVLPNRADCFKKPRIEPAMRVFFTRHVE